MAFLSTMNIIGSGMTAQHTRLDVISENITNMNTTRTEGGGAYRRKVTVLQAESNRNGFRMAMDNAARRMAYSSSAYGNYNHYGNYGGYGNNAVDVRGLSNRGYETAGGVRVAGILEDESEFPFVYDPTHPDANEAGYVEMPNVTLVKEVTDAMAASQAYTADVTAYNTFKQVVAKAMEIGE